MRKWFIVTAAVSGAVVMAVELLGARMLTVVFGGSLIIWAAMISVTLLSLAAGYFAGGSLADRMPRPGVLFSIILGANALTGLCPHARPILSMCHSALGLQWGAVAGSAIVFFLPLAMLGTVGPFVIRLLAVDREHTGRVAGTIYAVSTLGSVAGTLLTGIWLIPTFGTSVSFRLAAIGGALTACVGLVACVGLRAVMIFLVPVAIGLLPEKTRVGASFQAPDGDRVTIRAIRESSYGHMVVLEKGRYRLLVVDGIVQTGIPLDLARLTKGQMLLNRYYQELVPYMVEDPSKASVLIVGLAGGMTAAILRQYGMTLECVDIDGKVIEIARQWFSFAGGAMAADGRVYVETCGKRYDFCILDTYSGDTFPAHLVSREALQSVRKVLRPGGTLVMNFIGSPRGMAFSAVWRTVREVFPETLAIRGEDSDDVQTITVFASDHTIEFNNGWLDHLGGFTGVDPVGQAIQRLTVRAPLLEGALVLTDDHNPIDFLRADEAIRWRKRTMERIGGEAFF